MRYSRSIVSGIALIVDSVVFVVPGLAIYLVYVGYNEQHVFAYLSVIAMTTACAIALFYSFDLYKIDPADTLAVQLGRIVGVCTVTFALLIVAAFALKVSAQFSRVWLFSWFCASTFLLCLDRWLVYVLLRRYTASGRLTRRAAIVGSGPQAMKLIEAVAGRKHPWIRLVGVFDERAGRVPSAVGEVPVRGDLDDLVRFARNNGCDDILVALPWTAEHRIGDILRKLDVLPVNVRLSPDLAGLAFWQCRYTRFGGIPVLDLAERPLAGWRSIVKSILDRVLAALILLTLSPLLLLVALAIKLDSPGPVLFRQRRYGYNNHPITILKFRTLRVSEQDDDASRLVTQNDDRVTRVGALLRATSIDEFPQFLSVLTGEMSIVGPRPHAMKASAAGKLYEDAVARYAYRHKVKPGITGWAQINGWRGETDTEEKIVKRVEHDIYYIQHWSLMLDLRIILQTAITFFRQPNAY